VGSNFGEPDTSGIGAAAMEIPDIEDLISEFAERHQMRTGEHLAREVLPIRAISLANILITRGYASLGDEMLTDPAVALLLNMVHRNFSLADGAILAFATECGEMAEVAARASVESSVNIAYIVLAEPSDRLRAYFDHYFATVERQVNTWNAVIGALSATEADVHRKAAARRKESNAVLRAAIEGSSKPATERWPRTIEERFKALGHALDYRTIYARMSSEAHGDAEETLRYFIGKLASKAQFEALALETIFTTRLYVHYAVSWFLRASIMYALRYGLTEAAQRLNLELKMVEAEMAEISNHIGAGV
jgi:hypothetical protein